MALNYKANLQSFRFGEFQFEILHAESSTATEPLENPFMGRGYYAFDGANAVYHCVYDAKAIFEHSRLTGADRFTMDFSSRRLLWDGESTLLDLISPELRKKPQTTFHTAEILEDPDGSRFMSEFGFPVGVGRQGKVQDSMSMDLAMLLDGRLILEELSVGSVSGGSNLARFTLRSKHTKRIYTVDLNRGSLPLEVIDVDPFGEKSWETKYEEIEFFDGAGWLPRHVTVRSKPRNDTRITKLKSCNVARKPSLAKFRLDFDVPVNILDQKRGLAYDRCTSFSLVNRPRLNAGAKRFAVQPKGPPLSAVEEMPGELIPSPLRWYGLIAVFIAASILAGTAYSRYRKG